MSPTPPASPSSGDPTGHPDPSGVVGPGDHDHSATSDCDEAIAELYAFLDGELDDGVMAQVETHLRRCSPCLEAFDFEADLRRVIAAKCTEQVTAEVRARFCGLLRELSSSDGNGGPGVTSPSDAS